MERIDAWVIRVIDAERWAFLGVAASRVGSGRRYTEGDRRRYYSQVDARNGKWRISAFDVGDPGFARIEQIRLEPSVYPDRSPTVE